MQRLPLPLALAAAILAAPVTAQPQPAPQPGLVRPPQGPAPAQPGTVRPPQPPPLALGPIDVIPPPAQPLPSEEASLGVTRFSFFAYGDTRGGARPGDGDVVHPIHGAIAEAMIAKARALESTRFPVRFVLHSGDAVLRGPVSAQWNVSFSPIVERLTAAGLPYFSTPGNHDVGLRPGLTPERGVGLHNMLTAMSRLLPPEGTPRRLAGYPTYAVGFGNVFILAVDSNVATDPVQLLWARDQLARLDRGRYAHVVALMHHTHYSSVQHGCDVLEPDIIAVR